MPSILFNTRKNVLMNIYAPDYYVSVKRRTWRTLWLVKRTYREPRWNTLYLVLKTGGR